VTRNVIGSEAKMRLPSFPMKTQWETTTSPDPCEALSSTALTALFPMKFEESISRVPVEATQMIESPMHWSAVHLIKEKLLGSATESTAPEPAEWQLEKFVSSISSEGMADATIALEDVPLWDGAHSLTFDWDSKPVVQAGAVQTK
jgi:hypothetical protein